MSHSQTRSAAQGSVTSAQGSQPGTSSRIYRSVLYCNGIEMDHMGEKIPKTLRNFIDSDILKPRPSQLSTKEVAEIIGTVLDIANSPGSKVHKLIGTAMFLIRRRTIGHGGNTPWYTKTLPRELPYLIPPAIPKPDIHCGYPIGPGPFWSLEEKAVIDHPTARRLAWLAEDNCYPFLVFELKSEAIGGTLWHAENQAAGSGACCVNSMRWLFKEAYPSHALSIGDSIAFSACVTHREAIFHVHFYCSEEDRHCMLWIATLDSLRNAERCSHVVENIIDFGLGARLTKIRQALAQLVSFPKHWTLSRSASAQASLLSNEDAGSNKR
ncbi:MAG: hypothetical protein Q9225_002083 [Loekoesia sp. 1 TL-2023]